MADVDQTPTPAQTTPPPPAQGKLAPTHDPNVQPLSADEQALFSGGGGASTSGAQDANVSALSPAELERFGGFGGFTPPPGSGPPGSAHRPVPHPWADLFSALTTGLGITGGMIAGPEVVGATGLGAAADTAAATGANFMGRTVLPFLTRLAWRVPAAAAGAVTGYFGGRAAAMPAGGPPPTTTDVPHIAGAAAEGELGAGAITAGMAGARNAIAKAPDVAQALLDRAPKVVQSTVGGPMQRAATAIARPFAATTDAYTESQFGGPLLSGVNPTPAQIHPGRARAFAEGIGRLSAVSDRFAQEDAANASVINQAADGLVNQFGARTTPEQAGTLIKNAQRRALGPSPTQPPPSLTAATTLAAARTNADAAAAAAQTAQSGVNARIGALRSTAGSNIGPEAQGQIFQASANAAEQAARGVSRQLYKTVDQLAGGATVSLDPLSDAASSALTSRSPALTIQGGKLRGILKTASDMGAEAEPPPDLGTAAAQAALTRGTIKGKPVSPDDPLMVTLREALTAAHVSPEDLSDGTITFGQAQELNSELGKQAYMRSLSSDAHAPNDQRIILQLKDTVQQAMQDAANKGGDTSPLWQAYQAATNHYRDTVSAYDDGILAAAVKKEPRLVTDTLIQPGRVQEISDLWQRVGPDAKQAVQGQWIHNLLSNPDGTPRDPKAIANDLKQWPIETLGAIFDRPTLQQLTDLRPAIDEAAVRARTAKRAQKALTTATKDADTTGAFQKAIGAYNAAVTKVDGASAPAVFAKMIPKADTATILKTRELVGGPASPDWQAIQSAHVQHLLYDESGKLNSAATLAKSLGPNNLDALRVLYGPDGVNTLQQIQRSVAATSGTGRKGLGLMMRIGQGGALFGIGTTAVHLATGQPWARSAEEAGTVLLGPTILARIMTNPAARQWLTSGLEAKQMGDTTRWTRMGAQLANWLVVQNLIPAFPGSAQAPKAVPRPSILPPPTPTGLGGRAGGPPPPVGRGGS